MTQFNLTGLELTELSLVDTPANSQAKVSLFKRGKNKEEELTMTKKTDEDLTKSLTDKLGSITKSLEAMGYSLDDEGVVTKRVVEEYIEVEGTQIAKSVLPAEVVVALEKADKDLKAVAIEKADVALTKMAGEKLPSFQVDAAKDLLREFSGNEKVMEALLAANAAFDAAMTEAGKSSKDVDMSEDSSKLESLVTNRMKEDSLEYIPAYAAVAKTKEGMALINKQSNKGA
jgi:hypothetical protein